MKPRYFLFVGISLLSFFRSMACTPLAVPNLLNQAISGNSLLLNWESVNIWVCNGYSVEVEVVPVSASFTGLNLYVSGNLNKTTTPEAYPQQSVAIGALCSGMVYQFRARETDGTSFSSWTSVFTFTMPVTASPVLGFSPSPSAGIVCAGQQVTAVVSQGGSAPYTYTWQPAALISCSNCPNPVISGSAGTVYTCTVSSNCWLISNTLTVSAVPQVMIGSDNPIICTGQTASLTATGALNYAWNTGSTGSVIPVSPVVSTTYSVTGTNGAGCDASANFTQFVSVCLSVEALKKDVLTIYPNPAAGLFTLTGPASLDLNLVNELGQLVKTITLNATGQYTCSLAPGLYFITGFYQGQAVRKKLCIAG